MRAKVLESFTDLQDDNRIYFKGDVYPAKDAKAPTEDRFNALASTDNKRGKALIEIIKEGISTKTDVEPTPVAADNFEGMTVAQLKDIAEGKGLEGYSSMKKAELIELISK